MLHALAFALLAALLLAAGPAAASDEVLAPVGAAGRVSAHGGWVVFSVRDPTSGAYTLHTWHDGVAARWGRPQRGRLRR